ncbi:MAG: DUF6081 family protein [Minicystis sp.]
MRSLAISFAGMLAILGAAAPASAGGGYHVVWDDFRHGWSANTPEARWFNFTVGSFVADDGLVSTGPHGLSLVASGVHPVTHAPAFVKTMSQDTGFLSAFDHVEMARGHEQPVLQGGRRLRRRARAGAGL